MSGYLRWLAAQALGQGFGVRPVRHPISLARGIQNEMRTTADDEAASLDIAPDPFERPFAAQPQHPTTAPAEAAAAIAIRAAPRHAPVESQPVTPSDDVAGRSIRPMRTRADATDEPRPVLDPQPDPGADRRVADTGRYPIDDLPLRVRPAADETPSVVSGRPLSPAVPQAPVAPRVPARLARDRPADPRPSRPDAAAPADVHIHIGRVELTAVAPAAPARREPAISARKPMSLDEYLRRRNGRPL